MNRFTLERVLSGRERYSSLISEIERGLLSPIPIESFSSARFFSLSISVPSYSSALDIISFLRDWSDVEEVSLDCSLKSTPRVQASVLTTDEYSYSIEIKVFH